mgnify:FL=1
MSPKQLKQIPYLTAVEDETELAYLRQYIADIDDALTRRIFELRYIGRYSWMQVARRLGGGNTAEAVRKRHNRYLKADNEATAR